VGSNQNCADGSMDGGVNGNGWGDGPWTVLRTVVRLEMGGEIGDLCVKVSACIYVCV
jgi:hypothetical protein